MTAKPALAADVKLVRIFHTGDAHGPLNTAHGQLRPGQSLSVPEDLAKRLTNAYSHVKLAADVIPGAGGDPAAEKALAAKLAGAQAEMGKAKEAIDELVKLKDAAIKDAKAAKDELAKANERAELAEQALAAATPEALAATLGGLQQVVREFLGAGSKKDLEVLQAKHKDAVPAAE